jgi:hypothetical protein
MIFYSNKIGEVMKPNKPFIKDYILANPGANIYAVMKATGAKRDSVSTVFTILRRAYRDATINTAGLRVPEGLPPFTQEMFEQLIYKRPPTRKPLRKKHLVSVKKSIDLTSQPVKMPEEPPRKARVEAIDLIESHGLGFHLGMVIEYICMASRMGTNDGMRSLELAKVYLDRAIAKNVEPNTSR